MLTINGRSVDFAGKTLKHIWKPVSMTANALLWSAMEKLYRKPNMTLCSCRTAIRLKLSVL